MPFKVLSSVVAQMVLNERVASLIREGEAGVRSAVSLIDQVEAANGLHWRLAPESLLLCAEAAMEQGCIPLTRSCLERFIRSSPASNQFLVRAHYALGLTQVAPCRSPALSLSSAAEDQCLFAGC